MRFVIAPGPVASEVVVDALDERGGAQPRFGRCGWPIVFGSGAVIGLLGGLIGLGGAEFRLPLLIGVFGFAALQAVILNKAMKPDRRAPARRGCSVSRPPKSSALDDRRQPARRQPHRRLDRCELGDPDALGDAPPIAARRPSEIRHGDGLPHRMLVRSILLSRNRLQSHLMDSRHYP
jgi:hypothetical protein